EDEDSKARDSEEDNKARDSDAESKNTDNDDSGKGDEGSASGGEGNGSESEHEERSSPTSPVAERAGDGSGDEEPGAEREEEGEEDGRVSSESSASGQQEGGEEADQMDASKNDEQDDSKSAASCHDSAPASPSPSDTGAAEKSSAPSSPSKKGSEDEGEASEKEDGKGGSGKEEEKDDSDKEEEEEENSEKEDSDNESNVGELIANIFGESDDESEFEGFGKEDLVSPRKKDKARKARKVLSDSEDEDENKEKEKAASEDEDRVDDEEREKEEDVSVEQHDEKVGESADVVQEPASAPVPDASSSDDEVDDNRRGRNSDFMSDFDLMMAKKKEESSRRRRRKDVDIISDTDDIIAEIIKEMKAAAEEDKELNLTKRAATKKLKFLPTVVSQLKKMDLKVAFLDQGVLHVMAEWLSPLPDKSLPHLQIREHMLRLLGEFPPLDQGFLKSSGIGRAVMYLYKHPKESKENRERAGKLINEWARPIFNLNTNYSSISKEEREQKDFERMPQKRKIRCDDKFRRPTKTTLDCHVCALNWQSLSLRPGEKGWIARARVPTPSTKDYVVRPKWNCDTEFVKNTKKTVTRLDRHMRQFQERKKKMKAQRAVTISIEGRNMSL
ncbi:conserved hypothetical protein, partial [Ixodes scapularis]